MLLSVIKIRYSSSKGRNAVCVMQHKGAVERTIQHEANPSVVLTLRLQHKCYIACTNIITIACAINIVCKGSRIIFF